MDMEEDGNIGWADKVRDEDVLKKVRDNSKILETVRNIKKKWMAHLLNCNPCW